MSKKIICSTRPPKKLTPFCNEEPLSSSSFLQRIMRCLSLMINSVHLLYIKNDQAEIIPDCVGSGRRTRPKRRIDKCHALLGQLYFGHVVGIVILFILIFDDNITLPIGFNSISNDLAVIAAFGTAPVEVDFGARH